MLGAEKEIWLQGNQSLLESEPTSYGYKKRKLCQLDTHEKAAIVHEVIVDKDAHEDVALRHRVKKRSISLILSEMRKDPEYLAKKLN